MKTETKKLRLMAAPTIVARNSVRRRRLSSVVEDSPSFAAKLPSVDRGDVLEMDRMLDTLLNGVLFNSILNLHILSVTPRTI